MQLTRDQILAARPKVKEIEVPEWGGSVFVRPLTEDQRAKFLNLVDKYEKASTGDRVRNHTFTLLLYGICDEDGNPFFSDLKDVAQLALTSPASAFLRLQEAIFELSGFTPESRERLEKNSETIPTASSSSD